MQLELEIETFDANLRADLTGNRDGFEITRRYSRLQESVGAPELFTVVVSLSGGVATSTLGSWLYDKLNGRAESVRVERRLTEISPDGITRIIEETIEMKR